MIKEASFIYGKVTAHIVLKVWLSTIKNHYYFLLVFPYFLSVIYIIKSFFLNKGRGAKGFWETSSRFSEFYPGF